MFEKLEITRMARALAVHAGARQGAVAQNIANADTPGYRAVDLRGFAETWRAADPGGDLRSTRPGHLAGLSAAMEPVARVQTGDASPNGNAVSLEGEMVKSVEVQQQHDMALAIYRSVSTVLRSSLGRPR